MGAPWDCDDDCEQLRVARWQSCALHRAMSLLLAAFPELSASYATPAQQRALSEARRVLDEPQSAVTDSELEQVRRALGLAVDELQLHNEEYNHVTPEARLEEFCRLATGVAK